MELDALLQTVIDKQASDLHLTVKEPPMLRIHGQLEPIENLPLLNAKDVEQYALKTMTLEQQAQVMERGGTDFALNYQDKARFRVSVYKQKGNYGLALRLLPNQKLTLEEIGLSEAVKELLFRPRGLILMTGPTGSGKTTTLASMINVINQERGGHILTFEDPIEYLHEHKKGIITQRELGDDVPDFANAIRSGLRQDPDVMMVGEMRDPVTIEAAITAAETGHVVFSTLHTTGAAKTVDRILGVFPPSQQELIRMQLSTSLLAVISQVLVPRCDKPGRVAAFEIMIATPAIQNYIRENKTFRILSDIQTGGKFGMITLDMSLINLYEQKIISYGDLLAKCQDVEAVIQRVKS